MRGKIHRLRSNAEKTAIVQDVKQHVRDAYIRVTERSLTTQATTLMGRYETYQLASLVATQTGFVNLLISHVINKI